MSDESVQQLIAALQQAAAQIGATGELAWAAAVRYLFMQAVVTTAILVVTEVLLLGSARVALPAAYRASRQATRDDEDPMGWLLLCAAIISVTGIGTVVVLSGLAYWLPILAAPEGALVVQLLQAARAR